MKYFPLVSSFLNRVSRVKLPFKKHLILTAGFFASIVLLVAIAYSLSIDYLNSPLEIEASVTIDIRPGSSLTSVTRQLQDLGYIAYPSMFKLWVKFEGKENAIRAGEYELPAQITPVQLLEKLVSGQVKQYAVTLVEGWTVAQALEAIWSSEKMLITLQDLPMEDLAQQLNLEVDFVEGAFFPDTYFYSAGTRDIDILIRSNARLNAILNEAWQSRDAVLPYDNAYEALIMASIIEKESALNSERGHIAGVFVRRLELGMRLQSDPTVIYGMGEAYAGNIRREDLRKTTPYNTYRINGLPPTPIALSGLESIEASMHPLPSDYLYFVAKGDGSHYFSSSLDEHNQAVREFQLQGNN